MKRYPAAAPELAGNAPDSMWIPPGNVKPARPSSKGRVRSKRPTAALKAGFVTLPAGRMPRVTRAIFQAGACKTAVPIMLSRVTRAVNWDTLRPSVPGGRMGRTR